MKQVFSFTTIPLTLQMLRDGELSVGDNIVALQNVTGPSSGTVLRMGTEYEVSELFPKRSPQGFVIDTTIGRWYFHFEQGGGAQLFAKVVPDTAEEKLGEFNTIPNDILELLFKKSQVKRKDILNYFSYKLFSKDAKERNRIKNDIMESLRLLDSNGYITLGNSLDKYEITAKGLELIGKDKPVYNAQKEDNE